ncbi:serine protease [Paenibacillus sp.]|uniref:S1 family peptidase n=1 Tax=Paenibacillus sp. TaxID=58172 RepID=UPI002D25E7BC|nr:serine protease [Paenibacillus sp.]HZG88084.1 serine protease [Paenibacillus sp.]
MIKRTRTIWLAAALAMLLAPGLFLLDRAAADEPPRYDAEAVYERSHQAVFYVRALRANGTVAATGTGAVIGSNGTAVTAYHVVEGAERLQAVFPDGTTAESIQVIASSVENDAAVLKLPSRKEGYSALTLRQGAVKHGEKMFAIGYPLKNTPIVTEGIVNSPKAEINGKSRILTSAQIANGMSGGPLIDEEGRLAGVISGSLRTMGNIHLVVPASAVQTLLK